jgi:hypothetical protein
MENQVEVQPEVVAPTPENTADNGIQNTLGVIKVVEALFNALKRGSYPLEVSESVMAGMNFLAQFHTQLVSQLPPTVVDGLRKSQAGEVSSEPTKA